MRGLYGGMRENLANESEWCRAKPKHKGGERALQARAEVEPNLKKKAREVMAWEPEKEWIDMEVKVEYQLAG